MQDFPAFRAWLGPLGRGSARAERPLAHATLAQIEQRLSPALGPGLLEPAPLGDHSRQRIFSLPRTFWGWVWQILQANTSCREVVRQVQALFSLHQAGSVAAGTAAYCEGRRKLSLGLLHKIFVQTGRAAEQKAPAGSLLQGRILRVLDASGMRLPDTPENRRAFPPPRHQRPGTGFPYLKVLTLFSLASGAILAKSIGSLRQSELRLFLCLRPSFKKGEVLIMDRAYGLYLVAAHLQAWGLDMVARVATGARRVDFGQATQRFSPNDGLFVWKKPRRPSTLLTAAQWLGLPAELTLRIVRLRVDKKGFRVRELVVATSLLDPALYPPEQILEAYLKRWRLEMCFDDLKTTLGMESLHCQSPQMAHKELLLFLSVHNLLRWIMLQAARHNAVPLERISFKGCLDAFRQFAMALAQVGASPKRARQRAQLWEQFLRALGQDLLPRRPGRREPRAVKRRKKYDYLNKARHLYQDRPGRHKRAAISKLKREGKLI